MKYTLTKAENRLFRCRFCGSPIVQTGYRNDRPYFACTNEKCRAVVFFDLPEKASEAEHLKHYAAYVKKFPKETPEEETDNG